MEMPINDLLDRYSIFLIKNEHYPDEVQEALHKFEQAVDNLKRKHPDWPVAFWVNCLYEINSQIWSHESDLRKGQIGQYDTSELTELEQQDILQLAAVGLAAVKIREANRLRSQYCNEIADVTGKGYRDIKVNHASSD